MSDMDDSQVAAAFDEVFDQALVFHGFAEHMRDYDLYIYATADPATGIQPEYLRYRFTCCVEANVRTTVRDDVWPRSLDERLIDHPAATEADLNGYVWGVNWQVLYPGLELVGRSPLAEEWTRRLGFPLREATIEGNGHRIQVIFKDLEVSQQQVGDKPFEVPHGEGPDGNFPFG